MCWWHEIVEGWCGSAGVVKAEKSGWAKVASWGKLRWTGYGWHDEGTRGTSVGWHETVGEKSFLGRVAKAWGV